MIGALLGNRYELLEKIGEGGMADVYKAKCHILNRFVAIKILKNEFNEDSTFIEKFRREAFSAASLTHPNIVQIYDVGRDNNLNYIVFEYIDGYTLKYLIRKYGKLDNQAIVNYSIQICKALMCAHKNGIIHRDIKPHNILVTNEGTLKVTDFGIAKASTSSTVTSGEKILGTPYYISPEQARGDSVDTRTDLYSFGIVMYEMCTGIVPFVGDNLVTVVLKHVQEMPKPPIEINPDINNSLNSIVLKLLQKSPDARYQDASDVLTDLRKVQNFQAVFYSPDESKTSIITQTKTLASDENTGENEITKEQYLEKNHRWRAPVIWAILIVGAITIGIILGKVWIGVNSNASSNENTTSNTTNTTAPQMVTIPEDIIGKTLAQAKSITGLTFEESGNEASDNIPKGNIIRLSEGHAIGDEVSKDAIIGVIISLGAQVQIPDVSNMISSAAQNLLIGKGLTISSTNLEKNDTIPANYAIRTDPEAGKSVDKGTPVTLIISDGPSKQMVKIPNLIGTKINDAVQQLKNIGLNPFPIQIAVKDQSLDQQVQSTNPVLNDEVEVGSKVEVYFYQYDYQNQTNTTAVPNTTNATQPPPNTTVSNTTNATNINTTNTTNANTTAAPNTTNDTQVQDTTNTSEPQPQDTTTASP
ncbi:MAG: Stk1 family PASTA domain-containing Ser/Thr kinase [Oscillospiraceae bacterium]|nr:Stk1 family PASTA domain-containing Ser/Thr kinase [Oscillospiraceae bacterium]